MVSNDELYTLMKALDQKIDIRFTGADIGFENINRRIDELKDALLTLGDILTEKKPEPVREDVDYEKTATNEKGNTTVGPGIIKQKNVPKVSANGKIPLSYKIGKTGCKYCDGIVAWPRVFVTDKEVEEGKVREGPIHCDIDGNLIGDGRCPNL